MKEFIKYYITDTLNWVWLLSTLFFIGLLLYPAVPLFTLLSLIPVFLLVYNITSEYFAFMKWGHGKDLSNITFYAILADLLVAIVMLFIKQV